MVKVSGKAADISFQMTGGAKTGENREVSDDFRKLLQGSQSTAADDSKGSKDITKDSKPVKDSDTSAEAPKEETEEKPDVQTEGLLAAYQMSQELRPELVQIVPETAEEEMPVFAAEGLTEEQTVQTEVLPETVLSETGFAEAVTEEATVSAAEAAVQTVVKPEVKEAGPVKETAEPELQSMQVEAAAPEQKAEQSSLRQDAQPERDTQEQAQPDGHLAQEAAAAQMHANTVQEPVKEAVPEEGVVRMQVPQPEELPEKVTEQILAKAMDGVTEFEIHIEPENLGKIAVKILYQEGQATVSIMCSEKKALDVLGNNAREIGNVLQKNLGGETTIIVEKQENDYLHQNREENQQGRQEEEQQKKQNQNQKQNADDAEQFLQRLRLGLMN